MSTTSTPPATVFVTGGSGFVGGRLVTALLAAGRPVRALARSDAAAAAVAALGATPVHGSLDDVDSWAPTALADAAAVVHVAALVDFWGPRAAFRRQITDATVALHRAAMAVGVDRFVYVSAAAVVHDGSSGLHRAGPPTRRQNSNYGWAKAAAERALVAAPPSSMTTVVLRPPLIWGAGMPSLAQFAAAVQQPSFRWVDHGRSTSDIAHVDNVVAAIQLALDRGRHGSAYFITDDEPRQFRELVSDLVTSVGVEVPTRSVSRSVARVSARLMDRPARILRRREQPPLTRWLVDIAGSSHRYDLEPARRELGYRPVTNYAQGMAEMRRSRLAAEEEERT